MPRYWLWWFGAGLLWGVVQLPYKILLIVGRILGRLTYRLARRRRQIATINLSRCFPELSDIQRKQLLAKHFESLGIGLLETLSAWWIKDARLASLGQVQGIEHLHIALSRGKGVILFSAHFTSFEVGCRFLTMQIPVQGVYRPHENPVIQYLMTQSRGHHAEKIIPRNQIRQMLRSLKQNKLLWIASDQNYGHKESIFADFFGIPCATNIAVLRLAQMSGAAIVPFFTQRLENGRGYQVIIKPLLENFPSGDDLQDATHLNQLIEEQVRRVPEQYLWVHRRFKDRPAGEERWY
jgi:KDO2-lipid IV(A) lauroyltransferase